MGMLPVVPFVISVTAASMVEAVVALAEVADSLKLEVHPSA